MKRIRFATIALLVGLAVVPSALAQRPALRGKAGAGRQNLAMGLQARFDESSPAIGSELPNVAGYRADGRELSLRSLRGKYTVLVFGCLT